MEQVVAPEYTKSQEYKSFETTGGQSVSIMMRPEAGPQEYWTVWVQAAEGVFQSSDVTHIKNRAAAEKVGEFFYTLWKKGDMDLVDLEDWR